MAYPAYIREKARELRVNNGLTIDDLAERLAIPRTTAYYWVRDLPIGKTANQTRAAFRAGQASRRIHRDRRNAAYARGHREYPALLLEATFWDFVCMYIGEGYKRNRNVVAIGNSDPAVVRLGTTGFAVSPVTPLRSNSSTMPTRNRRKFAPSGARS